MLETIAIQETSQTKTIILNVYVYICVSHVKHIEDGSFIADDLHRDISRHLQKLKVNQHCFCQYISFVNTF